MGLRELRFLRLGGKVKAAELVIVESILKKLGIEVGKGGKPVAFQDGSKLLPVTLRMKGNALRVLLPPPPPPEKYRPRRP